MEKRLDQRKTSSNLETKLAIFLETQFAGMLRVGTLYEVMRTVIWVMLQPEVMKHINERLQMMSYTKRYLTSWRDTQFGDNCIQNVSSGEVYHWTYGKKHSFTRTYERSPKRLLFLTIYLTCTSPNKILNMVIPILMRFCSLISNWSVASSIHPTKCDVINDVKLFDRISQDILYIIFDIIQSVIRIQKQVHKNDNLDHRFFFPRYNMMKKH